MVSSSEPWVQRLFRSSLCPVHAHECSLPSPEGEKRAVHFASSPPGGREGGGEGGREEGREEGGRREGGREGREGGRGGREGRKRGQAHVQLHM